MATGGQLRSVVGSHAGPNFVRAGQTIKGGVQKTSPVKRGVLRASWSESPPAWKGSVYFVRVTNSQHYAGIQNAKGRNRGYVERGTAASSEQAKAEIGRGIKSIGEGFWVK